MRFNLKSLLIPFLFVLFFAVTGVKAQTDMSTVQTNTSTYSSDSTLIEIVDSAGNKVLTGSFSNCEGGDFHVALESTGFHAAPPAPISNCAQNTCGGCSPCKTSCGCREPEGEAKVDNDKHECYCEREIKVKVKDLDCCATYTVLVNGTSAGTITTNKHGKGELKVEPEQLNFQGQQAAVVPQGQ